MELRTCEFCGTEYNLDQPKCPICGRGEGQAEEQPEKKKRRLASSGGGARVAGKAQKKPNKLGWAIACAVLGAAVLAGIVYFFSIMDFFDPDFDFNAIPTLIEQGNEVEEDLTVQYQPEEEKESQEEVQEQVQEQEPAVDPNSKACTGLTISQSAVTLDEQGGKIFLTAVARPSDCEDEIVFTSTDETVATVTENGMITAVGPGVADIIVSCGTITQVCTITCEFEVSEPEPEEETPEEETPEEDPDEEQNPEELPAPELDKTDFTLFYPGEKTTLTVKNAPEGAAISYVSSNTSVVTVDNEGNVTAEGDGDATITVTVGDVKLTCIARCRMDSTTEGGGTGSYTGPFELSHTDVTLFSSGESFTLILVDSTGKTVSNVGWFASNGCVSISGSSIKAVSTGQATVSCVYNGTTYSCIVRCSF